MSCAFLEEIIMRYCKAYPIKKMIPASSSQLISPCFSNPCSCPVFQDVTGKTASTKTKSIKVSVRETVLTPEENQEYCVWLRQENVSYRLCTRNYDCQACQFEQMLVDENVKYVESPYEIERLRQLPAGRRHCKYTVTGKVLYELCNLHYECWKCPTYNEIKTSIIEKCIADAKKG
ncbi:MAG: hypothetical protein HZA48_00775 [Planctomycetes bacterium]|nr:hypothetical protein [Planctomycetota bacterium]